MAADKYFGDSGGQKHLVSACNHMWYRNSKLRTQLNVLPQPSTFSEQAAAFHDISIGRSTRIANYKIEHKNLSATIPLKARLGRLCRE